MGGRISVVAEFAVAGRSCCDVLGGMDVSPDLLT